MWATASPVNGGRGENRQGRCTRCRCRRMFWFGRGRSLSPLVLCCYQLVQQCFALDGHAYLSVLMFMDSSEKMKLDVLYHHSEGNAMRSFQLYGQIHKAESGLREARFRVASSFRCFLCDRAVASCEAARPFCVMRTGRRVSCTRVMYVERLSRHSENGTTSSLGR